MKKKIFIALIVIVVFLLGSWVMSFAGPFVDINYQQKIQEKYEAKPDWFLLTKLFSLNYPKKNAAYYLLLNRKNETFFKYLRFLANKEFFKEDAEYAVSMLCKYGTEKDKKIFCEK